MDKQLKPLKLINGWLKIFVKQLAKGNGQTVEVAKVDG